MKSCQEVTRLLSESMERKLSFWERVGLLLHLSMCKICSGFSQDLKQLREAARRQAEEVENDTTDSDVKLSDHARERIRAALKDQQM